MKNFDEVYLSLEGMVDKEKLNNIRKQELHQSLTLSFIIIATIVIGILNFMQLSEIFGYLMVAGIVLTVVYVIYYISKHVGKNKNNSYKSLYKDEVIGNLVKAYDSGLTFDKSRSIARQDYNKGQFEFYEIYHSDDYIYGDLEGKAYVQMGDVLTQTESTDSEGNTTTYTVFSGLFCMCSLPTNTNTLLKLRNDKGVLGKAFQGKTAVNMDSQEFEKNFDVFADDKILAMRLLTSDVMDFMINFKKDNKIKFDFTIAHDMAYIRIHCSNLFESSLSKDPLDRKMLEKYHRYLDFMCRLSTMIWNNVESKNL